MGRRAGAKRKSKGETLVSECQCGRQFLLHPYTALVNLLNPNPYLGWALVLGPAASAAWRQQPVRAVALVVAFYGTMVVALAALIFLFGTARFLCVRAQRALVWVSALCLAALGVYQLVVSVSGLGAS